MAQPNRPPSQNKYTPQNMGNSSFDEDYGVNAVEILGEDNGNATLRKLQSDASGYLKVNVAAGGAGDGAILDGANSSIKATVLDYTSSNPVAVRLTDTNGDYVAAGAGTQYTEDAAAAANPVGGALIVVRDDARGGSLTTTDGDNVAVRGTNSGEMYVKHTDSIAVTNAGLTELAAAINSDKVDVNIVSSSVATGGTSAADDADFTAGTTTGTPAMGVYESTPTSVTDGDLGTVGITSGRRLKTSATIDAALPAGTNAIGKLAANSGVDIGDVDILSSALPTGASTSAKQDTIIGHVDGIEGLLTTIDGDTGNISTKIDTIAGAVAGTEVQVDVLTMPTTTVQATNLDIRDLTATDVVTAELGATDNAVLDDIAAKLGTIDNIVSGNEAQVDILTIAAGDNNIGNVDIVTLPALAAGTNAIGKLLPPDVDVTAHTNYAKKYYTNAGAVTDGIIWSPAAGKRWHVVSLIINTSAAATVTLEDDLAGGDSAVMKMELAANSGVAYNFTEKYPFASGEDAADLIVTTTAGNIYITAIGYEV